MKNYFIKEGYHHKKEARTSVDEGTQYWSDSRLTSSKYYQYDVYKLARNLIKKNNFETCADVGCGSGYKLANIISPACNHATGIDQPFIIDRCKEVYSNKNIEWVSDDFENPHNTFDRKFDAIICSDVIEHLIDPDVLLNYIKSIAHKDSLIIISTPERDMLSGEDNNEAVNGEHIREWNQSELVKYLEHSGFCVDEVKLLKPVKFHFSRRFFRPFLQKGKNFNYCMTIVCRLA